MVTDCDLTIKIFILDIWVQPITLCLCVEKTMTIDQHFYYHSVDLHENWNRIPALLIFIHFTPFSSLDPCNSMSVWFDNSQIFSLLRLTKRTGSYFPLNFISIRNLFHSCACAHKKTHHSDTHSKKKGSSGWPQIGNASFVALLQVTLKLNHKSVKISFEIWKQ